MQEASPAPDWCQVRETVRLLELAALQIEAAMTDGNASIDMLTRSFTAVAGCLQGMSEIIATLADDGPAGSAKQRLNGVSADASALVRQVIIAFQFYDKLAQRLDHVALSLGGLGRLVGDPERLGKPEEWRALQQQIRKEYSTAEEAAMFEAVMQGLPAQESIARFLAGKPGRDDDVELF